MAKLTVKNRYATVPNDLLNDVNITFRAKGVYAYIQSKPDNWDFSAERISNQTKEKLTAVRTALIELEENGYLVRNRFQNGKGFWDVEYVLIENPTLGFPTQENPTSENPTSENLTVYSKKESSKKEESKKDPRVEPILPIPEIFKQWMVSNPNYQRHDKYDFSALLEMFEFFMDKEITQVSIEDLKAKMTKFIEVVANDTFLRDKPLNTIKSQMQKIKETLAVNKVQVFIKPVLSL